MARSSSARVLTCCAAALLCFAFPACVGGFKAEEFKKCSDANFCERNRGNAGEVYALLPETAKLDGSTFTAKVLNEDVEPHPEFDFRLTMHDGFVRIHMDEAKDTGRYQVPDVLADFGALEAPVTMTKGEQSIFLEAGDLKVNLKLWPIQATIIRGDKLVMIVNSRQMLRMEHLREKKPDDPAGLWEEKFRSHTDSKPSGPEAVAFDLTFFDFKHVFGIPERATSFALKPTTGNGVRSEPYRLYNLDVFEYLHESPFGLYGSIPMMVAHRWDITVGAFWLNAAEMFVDVSRTDGSTGPQTSTSTQWIAESGVLDLFLMVGPKPGDVMKQYAAITGGTAMPQMFALGYHQCRWNYNDEDDVALVDSGFDANVMPYDVLWLDIEHTVGKRYMTWDQGKFPTPARMQEDVASRGRKMVVIIDPHVKRDQGFAMHKEAEEKRYYVRNKDNNTFDGWCWPGSSSYLDMLNPEIRDWWAKHFLPENYPGSTKSLYVWNDMNEPSVFNGPEVTMQKDNIHWSPDGDVEHRDVHNVYGMFYHKATADGLKLRGDHLYGPDSDRPFVLSRAFFSGTQGIGPIWTGDNTADWDHLRVSVPMLLSLGITGLTYSGADVGGFFGNPDAELMTRWYQLGVFYPFFRGHAHLETKRREPWLFGEPWTTRIRAALRLRYQLLPTTYSLFRAANVSGTPVMRPLWYEFPEADDCYEEDEQFMFGPGILVRPVMKAGASSVELSLPSEGPWYNFWDGKPVTIPTGWLGGSKDRFAVPVTLDRIPVYLRGGHITVRRDRTRRSTVAMANDPLTLVVALDAQQSALGDIYLDDGSSFAFRRGEFAHYDLSFKDGVLASTPSATGAGSMKSDVLVERIIVLGLPGSLAGWQVSAGSQKLEAEPGPILMEPGLEDAALVVRKPGVKAGGEWSITFKAPA